MRRNGRGPSQSAAWRGGNGACGTRARAAPKTAICQYVAIRGDAWRCVALGGVAERCVAHIPLVPLEPRGDTTQSTRVWKLCRSYPSAVRAFPVDHISLRGPHLYYTCTVTRTPAAFSSRPFRSSACGGDLSRGCSTTRAAHCGTCWSRRRATFRSPRRSSPRGRRRSRAVRCRPSRVATARGGTTGRARRTSGNGRAPR